MTPKGCQKANKREERKKKTPEDRQEKKNKERETGRKNFIEELPTKKKVKRGHVHACAFCANTPLLVSPSWPLNVVGYRLVSRPVSMGLGRCRSLLFLMMLVEVVEAVGGLVVLSKGYGCHTHTLASVASHHIPKAAGNSKWLTRRSSVD